MKFAGTKAQRHKGTKGRRGFSFAEVLFAVAVLGIGFIMIAAVFPVAILQTQASSEETTAAAVTRAGGELLRGTSMMTRGALPYTGAEGKYFSFHDPRIAASGTLPNVTTTSDQLWDSVKQHLIAEQDSRFACVAVYSRVLDSPTVKMVVIGVRMRNSDSFQAVRTPNTPYFGDIARFSPTMCAELEPRPVGVNLTEGVTAADYAEILPVPNTEPALQNFSTNSQAAGCAVEGAYLVISDDHLPPGSPLRANGRVYRLSSLKDQANNEWYLEAGEDMAIGLGANGQYEAGAGDDTNEQLPPRAIGATPSGPPAVAFLIGGKGYGDPANPAAPGGSAQGLQKIVLKVGLH